MLYKYNKQTLQFEPTTTRKNYFILFLVVVVFFLISFTSGVITNNYTERVPVIIEKNNDLNLQLVEKEIKALKIRFPNIVLKQIKRESNYLKSNISKINHNITGMRPSFSRATTARGENLGFNVYRNWRESLIDYALYQEAFTRNIETEDEYYQFLDQVYCNKNYPGNEKYIKSYSQSLKEMK